LRVVVAVDHTQLLLMLVALVVLAAVALAVLLMVELVVMLLQELVVVEVVLVVLRLPTS